MKLKRAIYYGYYIKGLDWDRFYIFFEHAKGASGKSKATILLDTLMSVFIYNISLLEYFQFGFYNLSKQERKTWAGTGYMYEYQLEMNPKTERQILDDKTLFYKKYRDFFIHKVADIQDLKSDAKLLEYIHSNPSGKLVFKLADGKCGAQVQIRRVDEFNRESIITFMKKHDYGLVEEFIEQHPELNRLSPSAVNTVRVITQVNNSGGIDILGCRLRISVDSPVDNMAAGNLAAPINEKTGVVGGPGVYSDITKSKCSHHPVTKVKIPGFQIPFWAETMEMVRKAALKHPQNRSIGWDVVITEKGPGLIEGNHDWCKLLWQLPIEQGLKPLLEMYKETDVTSKTPRQEVIAK